MKFHSITSLMHRRAFEHENTIFHSLWIFCIDIRSRVQACTAPTTPPQHRREYLQFILHFIAFFTTSSTIFFSTRVIFCNDFQCRDERGICHARKRNLQGIFHHFSFSCFLSHSLCIQFGFHDLLLCLVLQNTLSTPLTGIVKRRRVDEMLCVRGVNFYDFLMRLLVCLLSCSSRLMMR